VIGRSCQSTEQLLIIKCGGCQESNVYCYVLHFGVVRLFTINVFNVCYSIRTSLLSQFLKWSGFLAVWCLFLEEMQITMEKWLVLVLQKWQK
jgi:hypothetical protein